VGEESLGADDLLFGVYAVQLGYASPDHVNAALAAKGRTFVLRLADEASLDGARLDALLALVAAASTSGTPQTLGDSAVESVSLPTRPGGRASRAQRNAARAAGEDSDVSLSGPRYGWPDSTQDAELGRGGVGQVVLVRDRRLGREVAFKRLAPRGRPARPTESLRFLLEARVTGQLEHPGIVPVYELGVDDEGNPYYTMRVVRGRTLREATRDVEPLAERLSVLPQLLAVCEAVAYAHSRGVIHRDLKPSNVMVGEFGETVVLDWGLAKVRGQADEVARTRDADWMEQARQAPGLTRAGRVVGTPVFMSPEQARGDLDAIDERSDVWALGAMLFQVLTGVPPFRCKDMDELLLRVAQADYDAPEELCPEAPAELVAIVRGCMEQRRSDRYQSAKEVADDLRAWLGGARVQAYDYSSAELLRRFVARHRVAVGLGALAGLFLVVGLVASLVLAARERRARGAAEDAREVAEEAGAAEARRAFEAADALASAFLEKAERSAQDGDPDAAVVFAAAALERAPLGEPAGVARAEDPDLRRARAWSLVIDQAGRRSVSPVGILPMPDGVDGARSVIPHPDGDRLFVMTTPEGVRTWSRSQRAWVAEARTVQNAENAVGLALSGDAERLFWTAPLRVLSIADVDGLAPIAEVPLAGRAWAMSPEPGAGRIALLVDDLLQIRDANGALLTSRSVGRRLRDVLWTSGGPILVAADDAVRALDPDSLAVVWERRLDDPPARLAEGPDGIVVAGLRGGLARLDAGAVRWETLLPGAAHGLQVHRGRVLVGTRADGILVRGWADGAPLQQVRGSRNFGEWLGTQGGRVWSTGSHRPVRVWGIEPAPVPVEEAALFTRVLMTPRGRYAVDDDARLWGPEGLVGLDGVVGLAAGPEGRVLVTRARELMALDAEAGVISRAALPAARHWTPRPIVVAGDGIYVGWSEPNLLRSVDGVVEVVEFGPQPLALAWDAGSGRLLAGTRREGAVLLDSAGVVRRLESPGTFTASVAVAPDGTFIAAFLAGAVRAWNADGQEIWTARVDVGEFTKVAVDPTGRYVAAVASPDRVEIMEVATGRRVEARRVPRIVHDIAWVEDGRLAVSVDARVEELRIQPLPEGDLLVLPQIQQRTGLVLDGLELRRVE